MRFRRRRERAVVVVDSRYGADKQQDERGQNPGHDVVEHNSRSTAHCVIDLAYRPGFDYVERTEQRERKRCPPQPGGAASIAIIIPAISSHTMAG